MKKCAKCGRELPLDSFHRNTMTADGRYSICKECRRREYYEQHGGHTKLLRHFSTEELREEIARREADAAYAS